MLGIKWNKINICDLGTVGAQQTHKLIISKFPHDDINESGEIQKRSLVTEDLHNKTDDKPVVNVTTTVDDIAAKPDENVHITVDVVPKSEDDIAKPREITLYLAGKIFLFFYLGLAMVITRSPIPLLLLPPILKN